MPSHRRPAILCRHLGRPEDEAMVLVFGLDSVNFGTQHTGWVHNLLTRLQAAT